MRPIATRPGSSVRARAPSTVDRLRVALCLATLAMLGLSWPLWIENEAFPRVPFVAGLPDPSVPVSWALFALLLGTVAAAASGMAWRGMLGLSLVLLVLLVLEDQHRFQPWIYQSI